MNSRENSDRFWFFILGAAYFILHLLSSLWSMGETNQSWSLQTISNQLKHLDSSWYMHIALQGYTQAPHLADAPTSVYAFFPLWPLVIGFVAKIFSIENIQLLGSLIASSFFVMTLILMVRSERWQNCFLGPKTYLGLFLFVFSPGSWVFCTNHTESLFLFLSWISLSLSRMPGTKSFVFASIFSGLAALTRNQGIFLAIAVAFSLSQRQVIPLATKKWKYGRSFILSGLISGSLFMLWPLYQWYATGDLFVSTATQKNWQIIGSFSEYLRNLFWFSTSNFPRRLIFYSAILVGVILLKNKNTNDLGLYIILSLLIWPVQGNGYAQAYRFSSVLFPFWFYLGDFLSEKIGERDVKSPLAFVFLGMVFVFWAFANSQSYFYPRVDHWPY